MGKNTPVLLLLLQKLNCNLPKIQHFLQLILLLLNQLLFIRAKEQKNQTCLIKTALSLGTNAGFSHYHAWKKSPP